MLFFLLLKPKFLLAWVMMKHFERHSSGKMNVTNLEGQSVTPQNSNRARRTKNLCQETHATVCCCCFFPFFYVAANTVERYWERLLPCKTQKCIHLRRQSDAYFILASLSTHYPLSTINIFSFREFMTLSGTPVQHSGHLHNVCAANESASTA